MEALTVDQAHVSDSLHTHVHLRLPRLLDAALQKSAAPLQLIDPLLNPISHPLNMLRHRNRSRRPNRTPNTTPNPIKRRSAQTTQIVSRLARVIICHKHAAVRRYVFRRIAMSHIEREIPETVVWRLELECQAGIRAGEVGARVVGGQVGGAAGGVGVGVWVEEGEGDGDVGGGGAAAGDAGGAGALDVHGGDFEGREGGGEGEWEEEEGDEGGE